MASYKLREKFWELPLDKLNGLEWESLCDGCGRCCLKKFVDEKSEELFWTRVVCRNFNNESGRCQCYEKRSEVVPDCINVKEMMSISLENEPYNILMYKQNKLKQICQNGNYIEPPQSKEKIEASRIEATYNMFNIITYFFNYIVFQT